MGGTPWGQIGASIGRTVGFGGELLMAGKIRAPEMVPYEPVDLQKTQKQSIQGNIANEGDLEKLLTQANTYQQGQANSLMEQAMPGWGNLQKRLVSTADSLLTNPYDVPEDVQQNLSRIAAERGISSGGRGQFNDFSLLRDLGINSLQYGQSRISAAQGLTGLLGSISPRVNPMSPLSFYVTPEQQAGEQRFNNTTKQAIEQGYQNGLTGASNWRWMSYLNSLSSFNSDMSQIWGSGGGGGKGGSEFGSGGMGQMAAGFMGGMG